jgi:hypothetical protein
LRVFISSALYGLAFHLQKIMHFDGSDSGYDRIRGRWKKPEE